MTASPLTNELPRAPCYDLTRVHADLQRNFVAEHIAHAPLHAERCVEGGFRVIFECCRSAEGGHDIIARVLLDCPTRCLQFGGYRVVEALEPRARSLRILVVGRSRRADEVGKEDGGELPLLDRLLGCFNLRAAVRTEPNVLREPAPEAEEPLGHDRQTNRWKAILNTLTVHYGDRIAARSIN